MNKSSESRVWEVSIWEIGNVMLMWFTGSEKSRTRSKGGLFFFILMSFYGIKSSDSLLRIF